MAKRLAVLIGCLFLLGCAAGNTVSYTSDAQGRWVKTVYSKSYISDKIELADGLTVVITGFDEGKVNPLAQAFGALGPDAETPPASFAVHFRNTSNQPLSVEPKTLEVRGQTMALVPQTMTLAPDQIQSTEKVMGTCSVWSQSITTHLTVVHNGQTITKEIVLNQETVQQLNDRMKRYEDSKKAN